MYWKVKIICIHEFISINNISGEDITHHFDSANHLFRIDYNKFMVVFLSAVCWFEIKINQNEFKILKYFTVSFRDLEKKLFQNYNCDDLSYLGFLQIFIF